jgi:hypothetical protein
MVQTEVLSKTPTKAQLDVDVKGGVGNTPSGTPAGSGAATETGTGSGMLVTIYL